MADTDSKDLGPPSGRLSHQRLEESSPSAQTGMDVAQLLTAIGQGEAYDWEFKAAEGGVPLSLYETYSAMANTDGGLIVLGVRQRGDVFEPTGVPNVNRRRQDIWNAMNNASKVSSNLLHESDVGVQKVGEADLLFIRVPRAHRRQRPVYVGQNPILGTFRRNYEGDYKCTADEVGRMLADQREETPDARILDGFTMDDIDMPSLRQYRQLFTNRSPDHPWNSEDDKSFLTKLGGWRNDRKTNHEGITIAGLLMFGKWESIRDDDAVPQFQLDYREKLSDDPERRWDDRFTLDGTWAGNLFQFYRETIRRLTRDLPIPFHTEDLLRVEDTPVHKALRESLTNALVHADYSGQGGVVISRFRHRFEMSNPGSLLVSFEQLIRGGTSECRNKSLQLMFQFMGSGDKAGSGIDAIRRGWEGQHWQVPALGERYQPDRVDLVLPMLSVLPEQTLKSLRERFGTKLDGLGELEVQALATAEIEGCVSNSRLRLVSDAHPADLTKALQGLTTNGFITSRGHGLGTTYVLTDPRNLRTYSPGLEDNSTGFGKDSTGLEKESAGLRRSSTVLHLSDELTEELRKLAYPFGFKPHLKQEAMRKAILAICKEYFLTLSQIATILQRNPQSLREAHIKPLVLNQELETLYASPNHPDQAYRAQVDTEPSEPVLDL